MESDPFLTIIIPAWNCERRIAMTLEAIAGQSAPRERFEVIVVDNGSTDGTAEAVRKFDFVTLLSEPLPGSYRARNRALAVARGEYVLFTDGDCVPDREWVAQALAVIERRPEAGLYAGHVALFREEGAGLFGARYEELTAFNQKVNVEFGHCVTANWLCRRDDLRAIGGFNQEVLSGGDVECSRRMVAAGHELVYVPEMIVGHPTRATLRELVRKRRRVVGGRWQLDDMSAKGPAEPIWRFTREAMDQARWTIRSNMESWAKMGVIGVIGVLMLAAHFEVLRLSAGRPPYRS
ncbi:glycosyltransferase [Aureimonas populi]|uniref:Glycosyltransferase n=1 Tax=Aureimonas populi TaxID=1701758 RepID=A0ABW5CSG6_9HYPH|nr:glycosyltransferase [Aureimonas populi]